MKFEIPFRIVVEDPLKGVAMMVQKGRSEFLEPKATRGGDLIFDMSIRGMIENGSPNFLGPFAQGPKNARFIYVNSGTFADDAVSCWSRRAKLSLMSITATQVESVISDGGTLFTSIRGRGRDGGPVCASVKGLVWSVEKRS